MAALPSSPSSTSRLRAMFGALAVGLGLLGTSLSATGCASHANDPLDEDVSAQTEEDEKLAVPLSSSPSGGATFNFCSTPAASPMHLTNAAWLAMFSANEYGHFAYFAPQLLELGFGKPGGTDDLWRQCGLDLPNMGAFEQANKKALDEAKRAGASALVAYMREGAAANRRSLGACAQEFAKEYTGTDEDGALALPAAAFKEWLVRQSSDDDWIQFFDGIPTSRAEKILKRSGTQVVVARHGKKPVIVIAFRGTEASTTQRIDREGVTDIIADVSFFKKNLEDLGFAKGWGSVHSGFAASVRSVDDATKPGKDLLLTKIEKLAEDRGEIGIWVTGHSLGGALATLMAARILDEIDRGAKLKLLGLYTFGSPRVGDQAFAAKLEERARVHDVQIARFRNENDIVPSVPFGNFSGIDYQHAGKLAYLTLDALTLLDQRDRPYDGEKNLGDHDIDGLTATRGPTSGYYSRILMHAKSAKYANLNACAKP